GLQVPAEAQIYGQARRNSPVVLRVNGEILLGECGRDISAWTNEPSARAGEDPRRAKAVDSGAIVLGSSVAVRVEIAEGEVAPLREADGLECGGSLFEILEIRQQGPILRALLEGPLAEGLGHAAAEIVALLAFALIGEEAIGQRGPRGSRA